MKNKKISLKLEGKEISSLENENLLEVAKANGVFIPHLCYLEDADPPLGTCRTCMVKVNGRYSAACTISVKEGMEIEVQSSELKDYRKGIVEMLFVEGNHICPLCEKSGKCELQALGYEMKMGVPRFPYVYPARTIDYNPKHIIMEHHRCIQCKRCVEGIFTDEGNAVFYFHGRGKDTFVAVDYEQEAKLSYDQAKKAMEICPVGTILLKEDTFEPFGERPYDFHSIAEEVTGNQETQGIDIFFSEAPKKKKNIVTTHLAGCFGCHMSMLDIDLGLTNLIELVEFNKSPFTDIKKISKRCDLALIEGGCCTDENVEVLRSLRENCDILVSVGACAISGNLPALRNWTPLQETLKDVYLKDELTDESRKIPHHEDLPKILDKVYPCHEVVKMDYFIPGCPPEPDQIWKVVQNILFGTHFDIPYHQYKYD